MPQSLARTINANFDAIKDLTTEFGAEKLCFTQDGAWYVPPSMRDDAYLATLKAGKKDAGTASVAFLNNQPLPVYDANEEQIGGFEAGDEHIALFVKDRKTGKNSVAHESYLEDGSGPAGRPVCISSTGDGLEKLRDPNTTLDECGMYDRNTTYAANVIGDPHQDVIWELSQDGEFVKGANYNYLLEKAVSVELTAAQLSILQADMELAKKESAVLPAEGCTVPANHPDFKPKTMDAFFPDGKPQYVIYDPNDADKFRYSTTQEEGALRVQGYVQVMDPKDMQIVTPYSHNGREEGSHNCLTQAANFLEGIGIFKRGTFSPDNTNRIRYYDQPANENHPTERLGLFGAVERAVSGSEIKTDAVTVEGVSGEITKSSGTYNGIAVSFVDATDLAENVRQKLEPFRKQMDQEKSTQVPAGAPIFNTYVPIELVESMRDKEMGQVNQGGKVAATYSQLSWEFDWEPLEAVDVTLCPVEQG